MRYKLMNLFPKRFRSKASQPAVYPLAIPYDMASKTSPKRAREAAGQRRRWTFFSSL